MLICAHLGRGVEGIRGGRQTYLEGELHGCDWTALALRQYRLDDFVCIWRCLFPRNKYLRICFGVGSLLRRLEVVLKWRRKAELEWNKVTWTGPCPLTTRKKARHQGPRIPQPPPLISAANKYISMHVHSALLCYASSFFLVISHHPEGILQSHSPAADSGCPKAGCALSLANIQCQCMETARYERSTIRPSQ